jgi:hypothetical protein
LVILCSRDTLQLIFHIYLYIQQSSEGTIIRTMGYGIRQITFK